MVVFGSVYHVRCIGNSNLWETWWDLMQGYEGSAYSKFNPGLDKIPADEQKNCPRRTKYEILEKKPNLTADTQTFPWPRIQNLIGHCPLNANWTFRQTAYILGTPVKNKTPQKSMKSTITTFATANEFSWSSCEAPTIKICLWNQECYPAILAILFTTTLRKNIWPHRCPSKSNKPTESPPKQPSQCRTNKKIRSPTASGKPESNQWLHKNHENWENTTKPTKRLQNKLFANQRGMCWRWIQNVQPNMWEIRPNVREIWPKMKEIGQTCGKSAKRAGSLANHAGKWNFSVHRAKNSEMYQKRRKKHGNLPKKQKQLAVPKKQEEWDSQKKGKTNNFTNRLSQRFPRSSSWQKIWDFWHLWGQITSAESLVHKDIPKPIRQISPIAWRRRNLDVSFIAPALIHNNFLAPCGTFNGRVWLTSPSSMRNEAPRQPSRRASTRRERSHGKTHGEICMTFRARMLARIVVAILSWFSPWLSPCSP